MCFNFFIIKYTVAFQRKKRFRDEMLPPAFSQRTAIITSLQLLWETEIATESLSPHHHPRSSGGYHKGRKEKFVRGKSGGGRI